MIAIQRYDFPIGTLEIEVKRVKRLLTRPRGGEET